MWGTDDMTGQAAGCGPACPSRRTVLGTAGAGLAALLGGCATYGGSEPADAAPADPAPAAGTGQGGGFARTADIPVGGGKIFEAEEIVVTQPSAGTFQAFSAICTHAGCVVSSVSGGTINCACHQSRFNVADGSVAGGPAPRPLAAKAIRVSGDAISLG